MEKFVSTLNNHVHAVKNLKHHTASYPTITGAKLFQSEIIRCAQTLMKLEEERIEDIKSNGPHVEERCGDFVITLLRKNEDGILKEKHIEIGSQHHIYICKTTPDDAIIKRLNLKGENDSDGFVYFIHAKTGYYCPAKNDFGIWISKDEATHLHEKLAKFDDYSDNE